MPRVSKVLSNPAIGLTLRERDIRTSCPTCGTMQRLNETTVNETDPLETIYVCREGCGPILIVSTPGVVEWKGRGYRMGDWMIRNPTDMFIRRQGAEEEKRMAASPHALD